MFTDCVRRLPATLCANTYVCVCAYRFLVRTHPSNPGSPELLGEMISLPTRLTRCCCCVLYGWIPQVAFGGIVFFFTAESVDSSTRTMVTVLLLAVFAIVAIVLSVVTFLRCRRWCRYAAEAREKLKEERRRARREKGATNAGRQRRLRTMQAAGSGHAGGLHVPPVARRGHPAPSVPHARLQSPTL